MNSVAEVSHGFCVLMAMGPQELGQRDTHRILVILHGKGNKGELMNNSVGFIMR